MKLILLVLFAGPFLTSFAQDIGPEDEFMMINHRLPVVMFYKLNTESQYIGLDGNGEKTMYEMSCSLEEELPNYKYYSEKYLKEMGCIKSINPNYE